MVAFSILTDCAGRRGVLLRYLQRQPDERDHLLCTCLFSLVHPTTHGLPAVERDGGPEGG